jgi:hypothetical protein
MAPKPGRPGRTGYSSYIKRPKQKWGKRIRMPGVPSRPMRFQLRSILRHELIRGPSPWWLTVHRRGLAGRELIGQDPLEMRAVPHGVISGYLTERILYAALVNLFHFVPDVDFLFQSSVEGGRLELGGLVADFLFPILRIVINPLGPQHYQFRNIAKDQEQIDILKEMGYDVYLIDEEVTYDQFKLEEFLRRLFGGMTSGGGDAGGHPAQISSSVENEGEQYDRLLYDVMTLEHEIHNVFGV